MVNEEVMESALAHLAQRRRNLRRLRFADPTETQFTFQEIRAGEPETGVKAWLERALGNNVQQPAIYSLVVADVVSAQQLRASYREVRRNANRGYVVPRNNEEVEGSTVLYVGSSKSIRQRLRQHLWRAPAKTYALNLQRWVPDQDGVVTVIVQSVMGNPDPVGIQDIEDALWHSARPVFGKLGRH